MSSTTNKMHIPQVYGSLTDVGCVRSHNEDSFVAESPLFVVADGMGGHEAGEVASEIAINTVIEKAPEKPDSEALGAAVKDANLAVLRGAADGTGKPGMGTTMTAAIIVDDELVIAQVGDSRAYLLHDGSLQRITRDHSLVADLVEQGRITEEEARYHPQRSVITRALGSDPMMEPDLYTLRVEEGDRLLLCSDGLSSMLTDDAIEAILLSNKDPQRCCSALVQEALAAGGLDNVTTIVVDPLREPPEDETSIKRKSKARHKGRFAPLIWTIVFVVILAAAGFGFYTYVQHSYYLIAQNGYVCVYKGLPGNFMGIQASWLQQKTDVDVNKLAPTTATRLESGISVDSLEEADQLVASYQQTIGTDTASSSDSSTSSSGSSATNSSTSGD